MFIINKKRISFILVCFLLGILVYSCKGMKINTKENSEIEETTATPVSGKVVVLDAGHGTPDERSCLLTLKITLIFYKK